MVDSIAAIFGGETLKQYNNERKGYNEAIRANLLVLREG